MEGQKGQRKEKKEKVKAKGSTQDEWDVP